MRPRVAAAFDAVGRGDIPALADGLAPHVHHRFGGNHALGGERHDRGAVVAWAQRLHRLFPQINFEFDRIVATGPPWSLIVTVEWRAHVTPVIGEPYLNLGAHVIRLRGRRVVELHAYEDCQAVTTALDVMAAAGIDEASAVPITTAV